MQSQNKAAQERKLPAISRLKDSRPIALLVRRYGSALITALLREQLGRLRSAIRSGDLLGRELTRAVRPTTIAAGVEREARDVVDPRPRPVVNATGVIVHTNLGRSTLSTPAAEQLAVAARGYLDLEYDARDGRRGDRLSHLEPLIDRLFPGHAFAVFNNNAAAILLCLRALSRGKEVLISRGELVEIGGSFRVPDILATSGARLREVGTTNRTRVADFEQAVSRKTGMILKVHTSNFKIVGFTANPSIPSLARLAGRAGVPLVVDWGSGDLVDLAPLGIHDEMPVGRLLDQGADLITFSGDKLLGGPQAGFVVGRRELVDRVLRDPLARAVRLDRLLIGALHQTLAAYVRGNAFDEVPTLRMLAAEAREIGRRANRVRREVVRRVRAARELLEVVDGVSRTGGGSSPTGERATRLLAVSLPERDAGAVERDLRTGSPSIVGRMQDGKLLLDLRTVLEEQESLLVDRLVRSLEERIRR